MAAVKPVHLVEPPDWSRTLCGVEGEDAAWTSRTRAYGDEDGRPPGFKPVPVEDRCQACLEARKNTSSATVAGSQE